MAYINHLGGDNLQRASQFDKDSVDVVPGEEYTHHSPTSSRNPEHYHRRGITGTDRQDRLEAVTIDISQNTGDLGPLALQLVCLPSALVTSAGGQIH